MSDLYNKYVGYSNVAVRLEKEISEALNPIIENHMQMGYSFEEIMDVIKLSEDYLKICNKKTVKKTNDVVDDKKRYLDFKIAEKVLNWKKKTISKGSSSRKIWMDKEGRKIDVNKTPKFSSSMRIAMRLYDKFKEDVDEHWKKNYRTVTPENICKAILEIKKIPY